MNWRKSSMNKRQITILFSLFFISIALFTINNIWRNYVDDSSFLSRNIEIEPLSTNNNQLLTKLEYIMNNSDIWKDPNFQ